METGSPHNSNRDYFERWKQFDGVGRSDKDRMITVVTSLLAFAVAILGYTATKNVCYEGTAISFERPLEAVFFSLFGLFLCFLAGYLIFAFGAYANQNWMIADEYREKFLPDLNDAIEKQREYQKTGLPALYYKIVARVGRVPKAKDGLPSIFLWFHALVAVIFIISSFIFVLALINVAGNS